MYWDGTAIEAQEGHTGYDICLLHSRPVLERDTFVLEISRRDNKSQTDRLGSSGHIEVTKSGLYVLCKYARFVIRLTLIRWKKKSLNFDTIDNVDLE